MTEPALEARNLSRVYRDADLEVSVLSDVNLVLPAGTAIAIVGASGSGKSTLLNLLGGLDDPSSGQVLMQGQDMAVLEETQRCRLRNSSLGFVYQFHHLLPEFSARENVAMPGMIGGQPKEQALALAADMLGRVGLQHRLEHRPAQLSGGERQRVAIARALVMQPVCVLMDEPTGNLDPAAAQQVLELLDEIRHISTASVVLVTHDQKVADRMDGRYLLESGRLEQLS